jgi:hypothetical protein
MRRFAKPTIIVGLVVIGCLIVVVLIRSIAGGSLNPAAQKPSYATVLPKEKNIDELGGWKRVSPPKNEPVFAYTDTIDGVLISVSQQPLPESLKGDVSSIAQKFNATNKIDSGGITIYIGTSSKGPQSVIFTKNKVLVLIKSEKEIKDTSWEIYAQSLN